MNPLVVTLAAPFVEVHPADFGSRPGDIRLALVFVAMLFLWPAMGSILLSLTSRTSPGFPERLLSALLPVLFFILFGWWWISLRAPARQKQVSALTNATRLGEIVSGKRLLAIRAIDDEASLTLALGTIVNYITARSIVVMMVSAGLLYGIALYYSGGDGGVLLPGHIPAVTVFIVISGIYYSIIILFCMLMVSRSVHGRELAVSPMECQINTQSTPDGVGTKIVTLVRRTYVKSLRHGIYDHEDCAKTISDWVRSQLGVLPVR